MKRILYITYDGLTDPLGQSQILPYLKGLAKHGYEFFILSFEKNDRYQKQKQTILELTEPDNIKWVPLSFTSRPPLLSKFYDAIRMRQKAFELHRKYKFDMVHCRSYIAADIGLQMKRKFGTRFFFDMRGFWADEKKDGGSWNVSNPIFNFVYKYYKKKEAAYLQNADHIISLTEAGKKEMKRWPAFDEQIPISVIPCCADMQHFSVTDQQQKNASRQSLGISGDALVLSYLGSIGAWYMLGEMLLLFREMKRRYAHARFLFVTPMPPSMILQKAKELQLDPSDFVIREASRKEVPFFVKASDINVSFIKPVYSKLSSSPTKLGEVLSMGIPVICNAGVGDVENIITTADVGYVIQDFREEDFRKCIEAIPALLKKDPQQIRNSIENLYSLNKGIEKYLESYNAVFQQNPEPSYSQ